MMDVDKFLDAIEKLKPDIKTMDQWLAYTLSNGFKIMPISPIIGMPDQVILMVPQRIIDLMPPEIKP